jgi:hypothetical protein
MTIHDWGVFADLVMKAIEHPGAPVTNKEARLRDAVVHVAGNWLAQPKGHGIEGELPLKKLHQCTDAEQIVHSIHKALPQISEQSLEGMLHAIQNLVKAAEKAPRQGMHATVVHDIGHDQDVVVGFFQSAIGQVSKLKDISHESKNGVINTLREACRDVRESSRPLSVLSSVESKIAAQLTKEEKKYRSFLQWFRQTGTGIEHKLST